MRKVIIFLAFALCFCGKFSAQNTLAFGSVKLISSGTVPAGKAWKIESIIYSSNVNSLSVYNDQSEVVDLISLNGISRTVRKSSVATGGGAIASILWEITYPIWLPEGTTLSAGAGVALFSIIEFNTAP